MTIPTNNLTLTLTRYNGGMIEWANENCSGGIWRRFRKINVDVNGRMTERYVLDITFTNEIDMTHFILRWAS